MATIYHVRLTCENSPDHYWRENQNDTVDDSIPCGSHPSTVTKDFVIEEIEETA